MNLDDVDLRHLRYFLVLADELHFTRAAEKIGIRQPPLSMLIRKLEEAVGAQLFHRRSRGVELTEAGERLRAAAAAAIADLQSAVTDARRIAEGQSGRLRVGFAGATYFHPAIPAVIRAYRAAHPDVVLSPEQSNTPALLAGLHEKRLDIAFIRPPVSESDRLKIRPFVEEDMVIAVPAGHALDGPNPLPLAHGAGETFILFPRAIGPGLYDTIIVACSEAGFSPRLGQEASQIASIVPLVAAGFGVSVIPRSVSFIQSKGVVYRPLAGEAPRAPIAFACRADETSALVAGFAAAIQVAKRQI